jgi:hypothetical protein
MELHREEAQRCWQRSGRQRCLKERVPRIVPVPCHARALVDVLACIHSENRTVKISVDVMPHALCAQEYKTSVGSRLVHQQQAPARSPPSETLCPSPHPQQHLATGQGWGWLEREEKVLTGGGTLVPMRRTGTGPAVMEETAMRPEGIPSTGARPRGIIRNRGTRSCVVLTSGTLADALAHRVEAVGQEEAATAEGRLRVWRRWERRAAPWHLWLGAGVGQGENGSASSMLIVTKIECCRG